MPSTVATSSDAPTPQLAPIATGWAPSEAASAPKAAGVMPIMVRPLVSKLMVVDDRQAGGRRAFDGGAQLLLRRHGLDPQHVDAALLQRRRLLGEGVDASAWDSAPSGSKISPVGPIEPPT